MFLFRRFIPIVSVLILGIIFEALLAYPGQLLYIWIGLTVIVSASLLSLLKKDYWSMLPIFLITILFFNCGIYFFLFIITGSIIRQLIVFGAIILNILYLTYIYYYYYHTEKYQVNALQNISCYLNLIAIFTLTGVAFSLILYLAWPVWLLSLGVFLLVGLLSFQTLWVSKVSVNQCWRFAFIAGLIGAEIFLAESFLPSGFLVNALIITIVYYSMVNLGRYFLLGQLQKNVIIRYLIISSFVLILTVVTARWI